MAALAALLFIIAWNMSEARHFLHTLRSAPPGDVTILVTCFDLTVIFDMVLTVAVGVVPAAALFIRRMSLLTEAKLLQTHHYPTNIAFLPEVAIYDINGPLFFGAAEKADTRAGDTEKLMQKALSKIRLPEPSPWLMWKGSLLPVYSGRLVRRKWRP